MYASRRFLRFGPLYGHSAHQQSNLMMIQVVLMILMTGTLEHNRKPEFSPCVIQEARRQRINISRRVFAGALEATSGSISLRYHCSLCSYAQAEGSSNL